MRNWILISWMKGTVYTALSAGVVVLTAMALPVHTQ